MLKNIKFAIFSQIENFLFILKNFCAAFHEKYPF